MPELDTDKLYEVAFNELSLKRPDKALWARAFAENNGDQEKAKAWYIRERVNQLQNKIQRQKRHEVQNGQIKQQAFPNQPSILTLIGLALGVPPYIFNTIILSIVFILAAILFFSWDDYWYGDAKKAIEKTLADPSSVQYRGLKLCGNGVIAGEFNAKNRAGGYDGFSAFIFTGKEIYEYGPVVEDMLKEHCSD